MNDQTIEQEIQAKGKTAPRVTPADIEANIADEVYFTAADGYKGQSGMDPQGRINGLPLSLLTFCVLVLRNGFTVTGESRHNGTVTQFGAHSAQIELAPYPAPFDDTPPVVEVHKPRAEVIELSQWRQEHTKWKP